MLLYPEVRADFPKKCKFNGTALLISIFLNASAICSSYIQYPPYLENDACSVIQEYPHFRLVSFPNGSSHCRLSSNSELLDDSGIVNRNNPSKNDPSDFSYPGLYVLQFAGPIHNDWLRKVQSSGLAILEPVPPYSYLAWLTSPFCFTEENRLFLKSILPVRPECKLAPDLEKTKQNNIRFACWIIDLTDANPLEMLRSKGATNIDFQQVFHISEFTRYLIYTGTIYGNKLGDLASIPHVRWVYPLPEKPVPEDELTSIEIIEKPFHNQLTPGYPFLLGDKGFSGMVEKIGVIDTGFDNNSNTDCHPDLRGRLETILRYPGAPGLDVSSHGTHVAGIIAGNGASQVRDENGFLLGCGIAPQAVLTVSNALAAVPFPPPGGFTQMASDGRESGALLCNNSWNDGEGVGVGYTANSAIWDAAVRNAGSNFLQDADLSLSIFFSAGNEGPEISTITSPKEAKNIVTVGACGSLRDGFSDELWNLSSRGPCADGRSAPTLVAPGISIYSCWTRNGHYTATGTSAACAHVTGAAALISGLCNQIRDHYPSPALLKAMLISQARIISTEIPDTGWGWGKLSIENFEAALKTHDWVDQTTLFEGTGESHTYNVGILRPDEPLDIILVWTDAPAPPGANPALVNDLDLELEDSGQRYCGNHFQGHYSLPCFQHDHTNNVERIRLRDPGSHSIVKITAFNIPGDGVPGNGIQTDQDYALLINNGVILHETPTLAFDRGTMSCDDSCPIRLYGDSLAGNCTEYIRIRSTSSPLWTDLELDESELGSGFFEGSLVTASCWTGRPGTMTVVDRDIVEAIYSAPTGGDYSAEIEVRCSFEPPSDSEIIDIRADRAILAWTTQESTVGSAFFHELGSADWNSVQEPYFGMFHTLVLPDLEPCTWYECMIVSLDKYGNYNGFSSAGPKTTWITDERVVVYSADMNIDPEWPVMEAGWEWGQPAGLGDPPDPNHGVDGTTILGYNLSGNYHNLMSPAAAVSPLIDCSGSGDYILRYYRWLGTESSFFDEACIFTKTSQAWNTLWISPAFPLYDGKWVLMEHEITEYAEGYEDFQFKFVQGPTDVTETSCGWNLDEITVYSDRPCIPPTPLPTPRYLYPSFDLIVNQQVFSPGERLILTASIDSHGLSDTATLIAATQIESQWFFYPQWTQSFDSETFSLPDSEILHQVLLDFHWPDTFNVRFDLTFYGMLINPDTQSVWESLNTLECHFEPSVSDISN
jgi:subtilisin family serine protease